MVLRFSSEMFQSHLEIGLVNDIKQWSYIFFPQFSFRSCCTLVGIEYLLLSTEENFYSRYKSPSPPVQRLMGNLLYINDNLALSSCCRYKKYLNQDKFMISIEYRNYGLKHTHVKEIFFWGYALKCGLDSSDI